MSLSSVRPLLGEIHHLGYIVDDLRSSVKAFSELTGAGPFFYSENVQLGEVTTGTGESARFEHSSAIGQLGDIAVEFMTVHDSAPESVRAALAQSHRPALHHVAWAVDNWDEVVAALESAGAPSYMQARFGSMHTSYHDASAVLGHHIEIHQKNDDLVGFFGMIRNASIGWDGSDLLRVPEL